MPFTDDFVSNENLGQEFQSDIDVYVCLDCLVAQTQHDVDVTDYYLNYQYSVGSSNFATTFMSNLATSSIEKFLKKVPKPKVLEIGSGDGEQLTFFKNLGCDVLGYEPSSYLAELAIQKGVPTVQGLFDKNSIEKLPNDFQKVNLILLSYTFDHIPEPIDLLKTANRILDDKLGILIIEVHDLEKIFQRSEFCLFEHEHSIYLTPSTAQSLLSIEGFSIIDFDILPEESRRANSLLFVATKSNSLLSHLKVSAIEESDFNQLSFYETQAKLIKDSIKNLESFIATRKQQGKKIAGYGAGGRGVMTLGAISNASNLEYLVDKNPKAKNIFTPKSHVPVFEINQLQKSPVDDIIVFSFGYMKEIKEDLKIFGYNSEQLHSMIDILTGKVS